MRRPLRSALCAAALGLATLAGAVSAPRPAAAYPKPSLYPISWQLKFQHSLPKRIVFKAPGDATPKAYWYMTFTVVNLTNDEQRFLPVFELMTKDGKTIRAGKDVPAGVFDAVKERERNRELEPLAKAVGRLLIGEDQARESVAIWPEPEPRMGTFHVFVAGLSGEAVLMKGDEEVQVKDWTKVSDEDRKQQTILRKTLDLTYQIPGDEVRPEEDEVRSAGEEWIMR